MRLSTILTTAILFAAVNAAPAQLIASGEPTPGAPGTFRLDGPTSEVPSGTITLDDPTTSPSSLSSSNPPTINGTLPTLSVSSSPPSTNGTIPLPTSTTTLNSTPNPDPPITRYHNTTTTVTDSITVTDYTTFCPYPTTVTITTCHRDHCGTHTVTVTEAMTLTVTGECVVPTTYTTETCHKCSETENPTTTPGPSSIPSIPTVSEGSAPKNIAGTFAGIVAIIAVLV